MKKTILFLVLCVFLYTNKTQAQLKFKNSQDHPIDVAIGYYTQTDDFEGWYSSGWYHIEPGETKILIGGNLKYKSYYYFARDTKGNVWKGAGKYNFLIDETDAFEIKNADKEYQLSKGPNRKFKAFKKIDVGESKTFTMSLTDKEE